MFWKKKNSKIDHFIRMTDHAINWQKQLSLSLDKLIFGLAAGALGISIAFVEKIVTPVNAEKVYLLITSWCLLVATILLNLLNHMAALQATKNDMRSLSAWVHDPKKKQPEIGGFFHGLTNMLYLVSIITLVMGVGTLTFFASINLV